MDVLAIAISFTIASLVGLSAIPPTVVFNFARESPEQSAFFVDAADAGLRLSRATTKIAIPKLNLIENSVREDEIRKHWQENVFAPDEFPRFCRRKAYAGHR
jgi:hypothetical protein